MTVKSLFTTSCSVKFSELLKNGLEDVRLAVPASLSVESARNYAYGARKQMCLDEMITVSIERDKDAQSAELVFRKTAKALLPMAEATLKPASMEGVAVLTKATPAVLAAAGVLLNEYALTAVEIVGKSPDEVEPMLAEGHSLIVSPCKRGTLLT